MTDHLPECHPHIVIPHGMVACICDRFRACEQRSYALGIEVGKHDGWLEGHAAGVRAARDAVAAVEIDGGWAIEREAALAAIDGCTPKGAE